MSPALLDSLAAQRDAVRGALEGLTHDEVHASPLTSSMSVGGIVHHLAHVERWWFLRIFAGRRDQVATWPPDGFLVVDPELGADRLDASYLEAIADANAAIADAPFDQLAVHPKYPFTLEWIVVHMIEETSRHLGHLDLLREELLARR